MNAQELVKARATTLAAINMGLDVKKANKYEELVALYKSELTKAGLPEEGANKVIDSEIANFTRGMLSGQFKEQLPDVDKLLVSWKAIKAAEIAGLEEEISKLEAPAPAARAQRAPAEPPQPKEIPFGTEVGDMIEVDGASWKGFVATVTEIDPLAGWVSVTTEFPKGKQYKGRTRFGKILRILAKKGTELPQEFWGWKGSGHVAVKAAPAEVQDVLPMPEESK